MIAIVEITVKETPIRQSKLSPWLQFRLLHGATLANFPIKPASPHLNGKVEHSHLTDKVEFYQFIEYTDDIDIAKKLSEWEILYNCHRPNAALEGKTPYEILKEKLSINKNSFSNPPLTKKWECLKKNYIFVLSAIVQRITLNYFSLRIALKKLHIQFW